MVNFSDILPRKPLMRRCRKGTGGEILSKILRNGADPV